MDNTTNHIELAGRAFKKAAIFGGAAAGTAVANFFLITATPVSDMNFVTSALSIAGTGLLTYGSLSNLGEGVREVARYLKPEQVEAPAAPAPRGPVPGGGGQ